jgi:VanZ family protein
MLTENLTKHSWRGRIIRYAPLIFWIGVILLASSTAGASKNTSQIIRPLLEWIFSTASPETITTYHNYIRKSAHFTEYAILAFFASRAFWNSSAQILRRFWYVFAFLIVFAVGSIDEYNQSFNVLRTGSFYDTLLDAAGGLTMILMLYLFSNFLKIQNSVR